MPTPSYLKVFEAVGDFSAIARGAALDCRLMLDAGYRVSVVAKFLDPELQEQVEWWPLHVPERGFAFKWLSARHFLRRAMGERAFDVVHAHQPQISDHCDVFQCHFLTRAAARRGVLASWRGRRALTRAQEEVVLRAEDRFYRRLARLEQRADGSPAPRVLFISELMRSEFHHLYGAPARDEVLVKAPPEAQFPDAAARRRAREKWAPGAGNRPIVGFLGGTNERKGFRRVLRAMQNEPELFLLFGGPNCAGFAAPQLAGRFANAGFVRDVASFFAACDALLVASRFEPLGMVALEAAAHGVPVLAGEGVGALATLQSFGAGIAWPEGAALGPLARAATLRRAEFRAGARRLCDERGARAYGARLRQICEEVRESKRSALARR